MSSCLIEEATPAAIQRASQIIHHGGIVAFPTETLYGLAVNALDPTALQSLFDLKGRLPGQCFPLLVADQVMLEQVATDIPSRALDLIQRYWPGPLTLVLRGRAGLSPHICNSRGGVGVRVSSDPIARELVRCVGGPITATSANRTGRAPATEAMAAVIEGVGLILNDGPRSSPASTVIEFIDEPAILRQGILIIDLEDL
jgi:L-threonylcarbamoyladenylate synthase